MSTVVDLGCALRGECNSLGALVERFAPERIYGFDPAAQIVSEVDGVPAFITRSAAWLYDGEVEFIEDNMGSRLGPSNVFVPCFDFSSWLLTVEKPVIVKMDIEGSEYDLIARMIVDETDKIVERLIVEWHDDRSGRSDDRDDLLARLAAPVEGWWM